jgi:hypothetical protein
MSNVYVDIIDKLRIRKVETLEKILEHDYQRSQVLAKLEEANRTEPNLMNSKTGIRKDSILKLHIVDAINLNQSESYQVQASQDIAKESTSDLPGVSPLWNEAIVFDIRD